MRSLLDEQYREFSFEFLKCFRPFPFANNINFACRRMLRSRFDWKKNDSMKSRSAMIATSARYRATMNRFVIENGDKEIACLVEMKIKLIELRVVMWAMDLAPQQFDRFIFSNHIVRPGDVWLCHVTQPSGAIEPNHVVVSFSIASRILVSMELDLP